MAGPEFEEKYATATHIYIPMIKRGLVDFAIGADWTPATGDVKVSIDGGAAANIGTLPIAIVMGNGAIWDFTISTGETTGKKVIVTIVDAATKAVEDNAFLIKTYGNAAAFYAADLTSATVLLSAGTGTGQLDFTSGVVKSNLVQILATALTETAGQIAAAFKKFFDKATPTGTINSIPDVVAGGVNGLFIAGTNAATTVTTALTTTFTGNLTGTVGSLATQAKTDVKDQIVAALATDTYTEPGQETPAATNNLAKKIGYIFKVVTNKITQTDALLSIYNNAGSVVDQKATTTNTGTIYTRDTIVGGP